MRQLTLPNMEAEEGMAKAALSTSQEFQEKAVQIILALAARGTFTSDEIMDALDRELPNDTSNRKSLGAILKVLKTSGRIKHTGMFRPSSRRHASPIRVWMGV